MRLCGGAGIGYDRSVTRSGGQIALGSAYFFSVSLRLPTAFWILPSTLSALPSASSLASPVALPIVSLIEPLISFADPAIRSLFMTVHFYRGHNSVYQDDHMMKEGRGGSLGNYPHPALHWFCVSLQFFGVWREQRHRTRVRAISPSHISGSGRGTPPRGSPPA